MSIWYAPWSKYRRPEPETVEVKVDNLRTKYFLLTLTGVVIVLLALIAGFVVFGL